MAKQQKPKRGLVTRAPSVEQVLAHPLVQRMATQLEQLQRLVSGLPEAVGRSVAAAMQSQSPPTPPAYQLVQPGQGEEIQIGKDKIVVGNKSFQVGPMKLFPDPKMDIDREVKSKPV